MSTDAFPPKFRPLPGGIALTFEDVLVVPAHSHVLPGEVALRSRLTTDIELNMPLLSAAMDSVTGARTAIAMRSEEHTSELQSRPHLVCRLLLEKKKQKKT